MIATNSPSEIKIDLIRIDGNTQARVELNNDTVAEYAEAMTEGTKLPPVVVFFDGADNWLADGFHRFFANKKIGAVTMPADVRPGTLSDAKLYAYGANKGHGLRPTNADKKKAVLGMLVDHADWSDNRIAWHVGVSPTTVGTHRSSLSRLDSEPGTAARKVITKHGVETVMDTGKIGKGKKAGPITGGATAGTGTKGKPPVPPPTAPAAPRELTEAEKNAEEAYGDTTLEKELAESRLEVEALQKVVAAAESDDLKAEAMKWRRISEVATRRQSELMETVHKREQELQRQARTIARICRAVGEEDPTRVAATVEMLARSLKVAA